MFIIYELTTHVKRREPNRCGGYQNWLFRRHWRVLAICGFIPLFAWMAQEERLCEV